MSGEGKESLDRIAFSCCDGEIQYCDIDHAKVSPYLSREIEKIIHGEKGQFIQKSEEPTFQIEAESAHVAKVIEWLSIQYKYDNEQIDNDSYEELQQSILSLERESELFAVLGICSFLEIDSLAEIGSVYVARLLDGKSVTEIRDLLLVSDDFSMEEKEEIKKTFFWLKDL
ncbi:hypothetical protein ADUPG1_011832 [Aduncisulcus paluster]|uniref:SKP1 component dimerisation domain-containing protein n=1 Tax=Aduncisulcus paluster TaxID=2918883 RepID=A0ABQ5JXC4_9EUKA|nr:hypothetical protein ADUPG1_011832 [Aduncisulcus paluster]|eukprot:gnl/Carplike_NY0171/4683_a6365_251.p1 GENE.gnl/Carplike_NY0171/4683_a6365_251~~gnl/Carplike_NY0171/4683_a6365_251.p1  ORF type:complete len:171 (+),score=33.70 gnl/Carplike_NY0171/4683_a6365_251:62-574(+)